MNPRLVKFAVDLQNQEMVEKKEKPVKINTYNKFFNFFKPVKVAVVVNPID